MTLQFVENHFRYCTFLSLGQTDRQVVASGRKLKLRRDLRWVARRLASFFASTRKSQKKRHFKADYPLCYWLIIHQWTLLNLRRLGLGGLTV